VCVTLSSACNLSPAYTLFVLRRRFSVPFSAEDVNECVSNECGVERIVRFLTKVFATGSAPVHIRRKMASACERTSISAL
jgi:hypothetical protein